MSDIAKHLMYLRKEEASLKELKSFLQDELIRLDIEHYAALAYIRRKKAEALSQNEELGESESSETSEDDDDESDSNVDDDVDVEDELAEGALLVEDNQESTSDLELFPDESLNTMLASISKTERPDVLSIGGRKSDELHKSNQDRVISGTSDDGKDKDHQYGGINLCDAEKQTDAVLTLEGNQVNCHEMEKFSGNMEDTMNAACASMEEFHNVHDPALSTLQGKESGAFAQDIVNLEELESPETSDDDDDNDSEDVNEPGDGEDDEAVDSETIDGISAIDDDVSELDNLSEDVAAMPTSSSESLPLQDNRIDSTQMEEFPDNMEGINTAHASTPEF